MDNARQAGGGRHNKRVAVGCDGRRWWNPPVQVSGYIDAVARQLPLRREKEGRVPIVIRAGEQLMMTVDANTLFHDGAARQRHWDPR